MHSDIRTLRKCRGGWSHCVISRVSRMQGARAFKIPLITPNLKPVHSCVCVCLCARVPQVSYNQQTLLSQCNMGCSCSTKHWDPVCSYNGLTYTSPCLAGCQTSTGTGKEMVRQQLKDLHTHIKSTRLNTLAARHTKTNSRSSF